MKRTALAILMCAVMVLVAAVPVAIAASHEIVKGEKGPNNSAKTWVYAPTDYGVWNGHVVNDGLRSIVVDVEDNTNGMLVSILHQRIRFAAYDVFPAGELDTNGAIMAPGRTYAITITPNGPRGTSCTVDDVFDIAYPPVAVMSAVVTNMDVAVDSAGSYDPDLDGMIVSYAWNFGDGTSGTGMTATHTYAMAGIYTITLTVTDNDGMTGMDSEVVTVSPQPMPPVAVFTATMDWMVVSVDATDSYDPDGTIQTFEWDFGDLMTDVGVVASHTYALPGTYTITLKVTDNEGMWDTATTDVVAREPMPPVAVISYTTASLKVMVDGSGSSDPDGTIVTYAWDFGDGATAMGPSAEHTYGMDNTYTVALTVTDNDGLTGSASELVTVHHELIPPVASFTVSMAWMVASVDASASSDPDGASLAYAWDFGDGMTGSSAVMTHTYATPGTYLIVLTVTDADMLTDSASASVVAREPIPPTAMISVVQNWLNVAVDSVGSSDADGTIVSYAWSFGDGATAMGPTASHTYAADNTYTITLTVTDNDGLSGTATKDVTVRHEPIPPVASFTVSMDWMTASVDGSASSDPDGVSLAYAWDFGDGMTGAAAVMTHTYAVPGTYLIVLTVTDADMLTDDASASVLAREPIPPVASFTVSMDWMVASVDASASYDPDGVSLAYAWDFGDGMTGSAAVMTHTYAVPGTYLIKLTVTDADMLTDDASSSVVAREPIPPVASFTVSMSWMTASVDASASSDADGVSLAYAWNFGDGMTGSAKIMTHTYAVPGTYLIVLTVTDADMLTDDASASVLAREPIPPVASFTVSMDWMVASVDASASSDADGVSLAYAWDFGDGGSGSAAVMTHTYTTPGTYLIVLTVTDADMLVDSDSASVLARERIPPVAMISVVIDWLNVAVDSAGSSDADGSIVSYAWNFGDGATAMGPTASHSYAMAGTYTITLTVTDNDGLTGVANKDVQVRLPSAPVAAFTWTATGATVDVDASSTLSEAGIASYEWSWGDGSAPSMSASPTASHTYGMTASPVLARHTVSMDKSANAAPIFLAPPPPYNCLGYVTDALGSPVLNAPVTITDLNTGTVWTTTTDAEYGYYMLNLNMYYPSPVGWAVGDTIQVSATSGTLAGSATGVAGSIGNEAYLWIDVTVRGTGPVAHDFVVTLTVTDMIGQTDSVTQTVTVYY